MPHSSSADSYRLGSVKICGMTSVADRDLAAEAGADYFGALVDVKYSPRSITLDQAAQLFDSPPIPGVALLFGADLPKVQSIVEQINPFAVELLGHESPEFVASVKSTFDCQVWKSLHVPARGHGEIDLESMKLLAEEYEDSGADVLLFTTIDDSAANARFGGTGMVGDWGVIRDLIRPRIVPGFLAGGLTPENILTALQTVRPGGIDMCTGVESTHGKKDSQKIKKLFESLCQFRTDK